MKQKSRVNRILWGSKAVPDVIPIDKVGRSLLPVRVMARQQAIRTRAGRKSGELVVSLPAGWELRLRRVLKELISESLPDPRDRGISPFQRQARLEARRARMREALCRYLSDLLTADIVSREVALSTRNYFGRRRGSLREQVQAMLNEGQPEDRAVAGHIKRR